MMNTLSQHLISLNESVNVGDYVRVKTEVGEFDAVVQNKNKDTLYYAGVDGQIGSIKEDDLVRTYSNFLEFIVKGKQYVVPRSEIAHIKSTEKASLLRIGNIDFWFPSNLYTTGGNYYFFGGFIDKNPELKKKFEDIAKYLFEKRFNDSVVQYKNRLLWYERHRITANQLLKDLFTNFELPVKFKEADFVGTLDDLNFEVIIGNKTLEFNYSTTGWISIYGHSISNSDIKKRAVRVYSILYDIADKIGIKKNDYLKIINKNFEKFCDEHDWTSNYKEFKTSNDRFEDDEMREYKKFFDNIGQLNYYEKIVNNHTNKIKKSQH